MTVFRSKTACKIFSLPVCAISTEHNDNKILFGLMYNNCYVSSFIFSLLFSIIFFLGRVGVDVW